VEEDAPTGGELEATEWGKFTDRGRFPIAFGGGLTGQEPSLIYENGMVLCEIGVANLDHVAAFLFKIPYFLKSRRLGSL